MDLKRRWAAYWAWINRIVSERAGFWGTVIGLAILLWKAADAAGNMDFIAQHWTSISTFLQGWGTLIGLGIAGLLIAKAIHDTSGPQTQQASPIVPANVPRIVPAPAAPPPTRALSPYEAEQKLRVIDAALRILREEMPPVVQRARQLEGSAWNSFRRGPRDDQTYFTQLTDCRESLRQVFASVEDRRQRHPEYRDISAALQQPAEGLSLEGAIGNYLVMCQLLFTYLDRETPTEAFSQLMAHSTNELVMTREKMERWHRSAERQLIALHGDVSARS